MLGRPDVETGIAGEARQVGHIHGRGDQKRIDGVLLQVLDECLTALKEIVHKMVCRLERD